MTWNVWEDCRCGISNLEHVIAHHRPDVVALQECSHASMVKIAESLGRAFARNDSGSCQFAEVI